MEGFLHAVLRSGLLGREELQASLKGVPRERRNDPEALADHLVRGGKLSRFQSKKLLKGSALGLVLGPFQLLTPIGRGGMGTVFLARDARTSQLVALKVLPPRKARTEKRTLARFRREMEMSQRVTHAHLAWTYEVGEVGGIHYIAMEFIPGKTLSRLVAEEGPLPLPRACRLLAEVARGLDHAHSQGLVHRDLKPSNIQITPHDHAKILDLGLAYICGETSGDPAVVGGQGYIVGTMDYIAPEQTADACQVDARADLYSLGCTLYFTLSGQPPFPGGTSKEKVQRQRSDDPVPLEELRPDLPPAFVSLVRGLMSKDPAGRPPSAGAVAKALADWAVDEPVQPPDDFGKLEFKEDVVELQSLDSSEYSAFSLPELEAGPWGSLSALFPFSALANFRSRRQAFVAVGLALLGVVLFLTLLGLLLIQFR